MKTWKVSELKDQRGYAMRGSLRIYPMKVYSSGIGTDIAEDISRNENEANAPLTGDSLIAALRERGVEVIDDTQSAKPVESKPDKWAHLPEGGEWGTNGKYLFHWHTEGQSGVRFEVDGRIHSDNRYSCFCDPLTSIRLNMDDFREISRAEAIAIFEANAKLEVKPPVDEWGMFGDAPPYYHRRGDCITAYHSFGKPMREGEWSEYADAAETWRPFTPAKVEAFKAKIAAYAKLEVKPPEADQLRKELDEAKELNKRLDVQIAVMSEQFLADKSRIDELECKLHANAQPPMSDERFRQEAAIAAMQGMIARDADRVAPLGSDAEYYVKAANTLLAAMKGGAQ
jgi:hypothetical protein